MLHPTWMIFFFPCENTEPCVYEKCGAELINNVSKKISSRCARALHVGNTSATCSQLLQSITLLHYLLRKIHVFNNVRRAPLSIAVFITRLVSLDFRVESLQRQSSSTTQPETRDVICALSS